MKTDSTLNKKLTILFSMHFEPGHHMGTFLLAKKLQTRGHTVAYLGIPDLKELIEKQGFTFIPFAEDLLPAGYSHTNTTPENNIFSLLSKRIADETFFSNYLKIITDGTLDKCLLSVKPDILLCDSFLWYIAIRALSLKIKTINISTSFFLYDNPDIPPAITGIIPSDTKPSRLRILIAWKIMRLNFFFTKRMNSILTGRYRFPARMHHLTQVFLRIAKKSGFHCKKNRNYWLNEIGAHLNLPEIVMCARAFQFKGKLPEQMHFLGDFVDFERKEIELKTEFENRKIILCSLGTAAASYPHSEKFFKSVCEASKIRNDWFFILHISDPRQTAKYTSSENLLVSEWIPQLSLLRKASVMVTHGGLNSIMECVHFKVPMIIFPGMRDQPGNAAKAAYHKIAYLSNMKNVSPALLIEMITRAMNSEEIRSGLDKMNQEIIKENGMVNCIDFVETTFSKNKAEPF